MSFKTNVWSVRMWYRLKIQFTALLLAPHEAQLFLETGMVSENQSVLLDPSIRRKTVEPNHRYVLGDGDQTTNLHMYRGNVRQRNASQVSRS
jgi:hypothetical protein